MSCLKNNTMLEREVANLKYILKTVQMQRASSPISQALWFFCYSFRWCLKRHGGRAKRHHCRKLIFRIRQWYINVVDWVGNGGKVEI